MQLVAASGDECILIRKRVFNILTYVRLSEITRCAKIADCVAEGTERRALSSWVPFVVVGAKILAQMVRTLFVEISLLSGV